MFAAGAGAIISLIIFLTCHLMGRQESQPRGEAHFYLK
jgi:hypothetical protein